MKVKTYIFLAGTALVLNLIWENAQAPLYSGYVNFRQHLAICFAAALSDVLIIGLLYFFFAIFKRDALGIFKLGAIETAILIFAGAVITTGMEKWALSAGRWQYAPAMPLIPYLKVGLLPVIQLMALPWFTFYLTKKYVMRDNVRKQAFKN